MRGFARLKWIGYLGPLAGVAVVTASYTLLITGLNATTVALTFLLVVLFAAAAHGLGPAILASVAGMLCFNFFFLPPVGTFTVHDPQNWVALFTFLATAIIASQLSSAARKRAWEAERSRAEVWKLYELSRAIIITPDPETAVSAISRQVREVFGSECEIYTPDEGGNLHRLAAVSENAPRLASESLLREVHERGETRLETEDGSIYAPLKVGVRVTGVLFLPSQTLHRESIEALSGLVALALERARFLRELSHTEALRQSDQLKSALLASVSHDLRTPLTSIRAAVDNLLEKNLDWDREALLEFHLIIREEVNRLTRLVQNLLEMARIEAGELHPVKEWGSVSEIVDNALDRCGAGLGDHRIRLDFAEDLPMARMDSRLIAEVVTSLVDNAAKYSQRGSEVIIRGSISSDQLTLSVRDHGPGIPANELPHIFDKFYRGTSGSAKARDGTGMGLAIARGIVEAHGGRIWAESSPGSGSTFAFTLPVETRSPVKPLASVGDEE